MGNNLFEILSAIRQELKGKKKKIILFSFVLAVLAGAYTFSVPKKYTSTAVIYPEDRATIQSPLSAALGSFGPGDKTMSTLKAIMESQTLRTQVAKTTIKIRNQKKTIGEFLYDDINRLGLISRIRQKVKNETFERKVSSSKGLLGKNMDIVVDHEGFLTLQFTWYDEVMVQKITEEIINQVMIYNRVRKTEKAAKNLEFLTFRTDSIKRELDLIERRIANFKDTYKYTTKRIESIQFAEMMRKQQLLEQLFFTTSALREEALVKLQEDTPLIQVLDPPKPPFDTESPSFINFFLFSFILALMILTVFYLRKYILRMIYEAIAKSNNQ